MRRVIVKWIDAAGECDSNTVEAIAAFPNWEFTTLGFLVFEDKEVVRVSQSHLVCGDEDEYKFTMTIPKGTIRSIKDI